MYTAGLLAAENPAILNASNDVKVNGAAVVRSMTIFDGDRVQVARNSTAIIASAGTSAAIAEGSNVTYRARALELGEGSGVDINTTVGIAVYAAGLTIAPAHASGRYLVALGNRTVFVQAERGAVTVTEGNSNWTVPEGKAETVADPQGPQASGTSSAVQASTKALLLRIAIAAVSTSAAIAVADATGLPASPSQP